MYASHASLRDLYEVSCRELDRLVQIAGETEGVHWSRMTRAGFGGCTVSLTARSAAADCAHTLNKRYRAATGHAPDVYLTSPAGGCSVEKLYA